MSQMLNSLFTETPLWVFAVGVAALLVLIFLREPIWRAIGFLAQIGVWVGGILLFAAAIIVTAEVFVRKAAGPLIGSRFIFSGSDEISGYLFAVGTSLSMAHVLVTRGHIRIDVLYGQFSPKVRSIMDIIALTVMAVFIAVLLERVINVASTSYVEQLRSNTQLRIPLAWSQIPWAFGIGLFFLSIVVALIRSIAALAKGDYSAVNAISGVPTTQEEIESEIKGMVTGHGAPKAGA